MDQESPRTRQDVYTDIKACRKQIVELSRAQEAKREQLAVRLDKESSARREYFDLLKRPSDQRPVAKNRWHQMIDNANAVRVEIAGLESDIFNAFEALENTIAELATLPRPKREKGKNEPKEERPKKHRKKLRGPRRKKGTQPQATEADTQVIDLQEAKDARRGADVADMAARLQAGIGSTAK